jgi:hypothetical protein
VRSGKQVLIRRLISFVLLSALVLSSSPIFVSGLISAVATDAALGTTSISTAGGQKLIEDSFGKHLVVYVDSSGLLGVAFANGDPTLSGAWTVAKSQAPAYPYARPAAVLVSPTSLRIIAEGGSGTGQLVDVPVSISRDSSGNISGVAFGVGTVLDISGYAKYAAAILTHDGGIVLVWNVRQSGVVSKINSLRWTLQNGWTSVSNPASTSPDTVIMDTSDTYAMIVSVIERKDNFELYVVGDRSQTSPSTTLVFNSAVYNGQSWAWGIQNLAYETNASRGLTDATSVAWDPVRSLVVVAYDITNVNAYGVFTLDASDRKVHLDTPLVVVRDNDWGTIIVDQYTGNYYLFFMDAIYDEGGPGKVEYITHTDGWNATQTIIDSEDTNLGISVERTTAHGIDIIYSKGTSAPTTIEFARLGPFNSPDFTISANPSYIAIEPGSTGSSIISLAGSKSFNGTVSLIASVSPSGPQLSINPSSEALSSGSTANSTLTVSATSAVPGGNYSIAVKASGNGITHIVNLKLTVGSNFTISANPSSLTFLSSSSGQSTISLQSLGFTGTVSLTANVSAPGLTASLNPTSIALSPGQSLSSTLTVSSKIPGAYTVSVLGTGGSEVHAVNVAVEVADFSLSAVPTQLTILAGSSGASLITLNSLDGFTGSISLSSSISPGGPHVSFNPSNVALVAGGTANSTLHVSTSANNAAGNYSITVKGSAGSITHLITIALTVTSGLTISASPSSVTFLSGSTGKSTIKLQSLGLTGTVTLSDEVSRTGLVVVISPMTMSFSPGQTHSATLAVSSSSPGTYIITVIATVGSLSSSVNVSVAVTDFTITATPTSLSITRGSSSNSTITFTSLYGFSGTISLQASVTPSGPTPKLGSDKVSVSAGGTATALLTISTATTTIPSNYTIIVKATDGSLVHTVSIIVTVT